MKLTFPEAQEAVRLYANGMLGYDGLVNSLERCPKRVIVELVLDLAAEADRVFLSPEHFIRRPKLALKNDGSPLIVWPMSEGGKSC